MSENNEFYKKGSLPKGLMEDAAKKKENVIGINGQTLPQYEEPLPFDIHLSPSTKFPIDCLPSDLKNFIYKIHNIVKAPLAMCAQCVLSAIALVAQSHANILIDGRRHPLSIFFLTVGESGERKSAVDKIVLFIIQEFEKELHALYEQECERHKQAQDHNDSLYKKDKRAASVNIDKPIEPIILVSEPTYEGLVNAFRYGQPSLGLYSSEGGRFTGGHAMKQENKLKTMAGFSDMWSGEPISISRGGDGNLKLYDKRLSLHLMIQPKIAREMFSDVVLVDQGFLARCFISYPDSTMGNRPYTEEDIYITKEYRIYADKVKHLLETKPVYIKDSVFRDISLTPEAKTVAVAFHDEIEMGLCPNGPYREVSGFAAKSLEHACRIAGVIALYNNPLVESISQETMANAIVLIRFYLSEAVRLISPKEKIEEMHDSELLRDAKQLYTWLTEKANPDKKITCRYIYQFAHRKFKARELILKLLSILVEDGYLTVSGNAKEWFIIDRK